MPKWTKDMGEVERLARVSDVITSAGPAPYLVVRLLDGSTVSGRVISGHTENNGIRMPRSYCGAVRLLTSEGETEIDYLDVETVSSQRPN
jgi:hypothetical protein